MGAACCKRLEPGTSSPQLPFCEVLRRCARVMCPVDPPQQKPVYRTRKYGLSDIVGPVTKKDSWSQTDPQPPPRLRRKQRRRSRSVEFLPYLLEQEVARRGSLEDLAGQEDVLDFQMYFMSRLPKESLDEGKDALTDRKKEFLSGLLSEENNNLVPIGAEPTLLERKVEDAERQKSSEQTAGTKLAPPNEPTEGATSSRRSSITESLREFESSLLEMLELEEDAHPGERTEEDDEEDVVVKMMVPLKRKDLPTLEESEEEYVISPLEEEEEGRKTVFVPEVQEVQTTGTVEKKNDNNENESTVQSDLSSSSSLSKTYFKDKPPTITVEIVS